MRTLYVAGRFGFVSRNIFWNHISRRQKSENYSNWAKLLASGLLKPYQASAQHLCLSRAGIRVLQESNGDYVGKAHPMYFPHDELVMAVALACENADLIRATWTNDAVLRAMPTIGQVQLLGAKAEKIPDLVFDLKVGGESTRVALEVERTRKSIARYDTLVLSYMQMRSIDLVIIAFNDRYTEKQIKSSIRKLGYPQSVRPIAFCKIADLNLNPSSFLISIGETVIAFNKFVENLRKIEGSDTGDISRIRPEKAPETLPGKIPVKRVG
jgi:hypothetical protein